MSAKGTKKADVLLSGEKIVAVGRHLSADARVVDVSGKLIFPGFIDAETHFDCDDGGVATADDFESGTVSAVAGGVTTVVDCAVPHRDERLSDALNNWHVKAFSNASCDYAFHMAVPEWRPELKEELPAMFEQGVTSFVITMDDGGLSDDGLFEMMSELGRRGGIVVCRCENDRLVAKLSERALARGETAPRCYPLTRPDYTEAEAIHRVLTVARAVESPCVITRLSTAVGYQEVLRARESGVAVYVQTCPRYLLLDEGVYQEPFARSAGCICTPPLRKAEDHRVLWQALRNGDLSTVSSDHRAYTMEQKSMGEGDFTAVPAGMPGVETRAALLYTYGVHKRRISLSQMCAYLSENPARLYGMYPKKGVVRVGSDADLVIFDPRGSGVISAATSHSRCDYSPYEGVRTLGGVDKVYLRGRLVYHHGEVVLENSGRYVPRGGLSR